MSCMETISGDFVQNDHENTSSVIDSVSYNYIHVRHENPCNFSAMY